jgi:hypothetical protein
MGSKRRLFMYIPRLIDFYKELGGMFGLYEWRSMDKTQYMNDVQHITGQEMYREVRATTNFDQ